MKIMELKQVAKHKCGKFLKNGIKLEPHEEDAAKYLILFGFDIEVIRPVNTPKVHNPDFLMTGTIWEVKSPTTYNLKTIKKRMHEASEQATHVVVDLRGIKRMHMEVEKEVIRRFCAERNIRRMILITKLGNVVDYRK